MIRYYGIYARHRKSDQLLRRAISREKHRIYLPFNYWWTSILRSFGYDPLKCQDCGSTMLFLELYFKHKPGPHDTILVSYMRIEVDSIKRITEAELAKKTTGTIHTEPARRYDF